MSVSGLLGKSSPSQLNYFKLYTLPNTVDFVTTDLKVTNLASTNAKVRVAVGVNDTPAKVDFVEYDAVVLANGGELNRTCIMISGGESVYIYSDINNVTFRLTGVETRIKSIVNWTINGDNKSATLNLSQSLSVTNVLQTSAQYDASGNLLTKQLSSIIGTTDILGNATVSINFTQVPDSVSETKWTYINGLLVDETSFNYGAGGIITKV